MFKKTYICVFALFFVMLFFSTGVFAVPTLQLGAPGGPGEGTYADYQDDLSNPVETDTAVTSGSIIYAAATYGSGVDLVGGQYNDSDENWSSFGFDPVFDTAGAIIMATVPDGTLDSGYLMINGAAAIYSTGELDDGFNVPNPPSNHDPIKGKDYLFFDLGDFHEVGEVPNFDTESGSASGEIKELVIDTSGFEWIHFDLFALVSKEKGRDVQVKVTGEPGSKDLTKIGSVPIPEPGTLLLLGSGVIGLLYNRKKISG